MRFGTQKPVRRVPTLAERMFGQRLAGRLGVGKPAEQRDDLSIARGQALGALLRGEPVPNVWSEHLEPMFRELWDTTLEAVREAGRTHETEKLYRCLGGLDALDKWGQKFDEALILAAGALERQEERHLRAVAAAEHPKERTPA